MTKHQMGRLILTTNDLDFTTKRVWYYLAKKYPAMPVDSLAWKIAEDMTGLCVDLNMSKDAFYKHLEILNQFCARRKTNIPLGIGGETKYGC